MNRVSRMDEIIAVSPSHLRGLFHHTYEIINLTLAVFPPVSFGGNQLKEHYGLTRLSSTVVRYKNILLNHLTN